MRVTQKEEEIEFPYAGYVRQPVLSAVPTARYARDGCFRDCHAIFDIEIIDPDDILKRVYLMINDQQMEISKEDLQNEFTEEKPLLVLCMSFSMDKLWLCSNSPGKITVRWKTIVYEESKISKIQTFPYKFKHPNCWITYGNGAALMIQKNGYIKPGPDVVFQNCVDQLS